MKISNRLVLTAMVGLAFGCASSEPQQPTHRWASSEAVSGIEYSNDHARCMSMANLESETEFQASSREFAAYKSCMETRGYELTASN